MNVERASFAVSDCGQDLVRVVESRCDNGGVTAKLAGISPPWNSQSVDLGGFREVFVPSAFDKILGRHKNDPRGTADVVGLFNHDESQVLSRTTNGSLRLVKEDRGLAYEMGPLPNTQAARDLLTLVREGLVFGSSFAFTVSPKGEQWSEDERGNVTRTIVEASGLFDVSVVTRPAYPSSTVGLRSLDLWRTARRMADAGGQERGLTISLDYDRTFTAAPGLWRSFVVDAVARGNRVVCISRRDDTDENRSELRLAFGDLELAGVLLCGTETQKRAAAAAAGLEVDVWIDDYPEGIVDKPLKSAERSFKISSSAGIRAAAAAAVARMRAHAG